MFCFGVVSLLRCWDFGVVGFFRDVHALANRAIISEFDYFVAKLESSVLIFFF